jgi:hypothetical protein
LSNHHFDNASKKQNSKPKDNNEKGANNNNKEETQKMSFAMLEGKCYCCGKVGHKSLSCPLKTKLRRRVGNQQSQIHRAITSEY